MRTPRTATSVLLVPGITARNDRQVGERGVVLIVALVVCALIAVGLAGYLSLNLSTSRLSQRGFNTYAALNLAEAGVEEAVWSFNRASAGNADAWDQWTASGQSAHRKFSGFELGNNTTGSVKVYVDNSQPTSTSRPKIVTESTVSTPGSIPQSRLIEVTLRRRSSFANGLVAKQSIVFSGTNASVDSWDSNPDQNPLTAPVDYSTLNRTDHGTVATASFASNSILINQADIWGYVATGGSAPSVGTNGTIRGADTPAGVTVDPRRIATDFNASFPIIQSPIDGTPLAAIPSTLGTTGTKTRWRATQLSLSGNQSLTILGDVTLILTMTTAGDALSVTGNASIIIEKDAKFTVYAEGGIKVAGNGLLNNNIQPSTCQFWGTSTSPAGQAIMIAGNGALRCVVYAPYGDVTVNGNGDVMGSIVSQSIRFTGNAAFHYDESLAIGQNNEPFAIGKWRELTSELERAPYRAIFQGW